MRAAPVGPATMRDPLVRRLALRLALAQMAAALSEGVGLILLVPLLGTLTAPGEGGGALGVLLLLVANGANQALNRGRLVVSNSK